MNELHWDDFFIETHYKMSYKCNRKVQSTKFDVSIIKNARIYILNCRGSDVNTIFKWTSGGKLAMRYELLICTFIENMHGLSMPK